MRMTIYALFYTLWGGGSYFMANPEDIPRSCPNLLALGIPCPTPRGTSNISARTISNTDPVTSLTTYADLLGQVPGIVIGRDGVVHFPKGFNAASFYSGNTSTALVTSGGWNGGKVGESGEGCTVRNIVTPAIPGGEGRVIGVSQSCPGKDVVSFSNGRSPAAPRPCTANKDSNGTVTINCPDASTFKIESILAAAKGRSCADDSNCIKELADKILSPPNKTSFEVYAFLNSQVAPWLSSKCEGRRFFRGNYFNPVPSGRDGIPFYSQNGCYDCQLRRGTAPSNCGG